MCPATILANKRSDKLINLKIYDIISIRAKKGINTLGIPTTQNIENKRVLKNFKPINIIPNQQINEIIPVILKWLFIVLENGIKPIKLFRNICIYI